MKASFSDLHRKSAQIIRALDRNESVTLFYRGRAVGVICPIGSPSKRTWRKTRDNPAFGMWADRADLRDTPAHVRRLRRGRGQS